MIMNMQMTTNGDDDDDDEWERYAICVHVAGEYYNDTYKILFTQFLYETKCRRFMKNPKGLRDFDLGLKKFIFSFI